MEGSHDPHVEVVSIITQVVTIWYMYHIQRKATGILTECQSFHCELDYLLDVLLLHQTKRILLLL